MDTETLQLHLVSPVLKLWDVILTLQARRVMEATLTVPLDTSVLKLLTLLSNVLQELRELLLELVLKQIALPVELVVNGVLREVQPMELALLVTSAPLKKLPFRKNGVALLESGLPLAPLMPLEVVLTAWPVNGAEKVLIPRLLTKTDAKLPTMNARLELLNLQHVLLDHTSTQLLLVTLAHLALPVATVLEWLVSLYVPLVTNQRLPKVLVSPLLPVHPPSQEKRKELVPRLPMASGTSPVPSSVTKLSALVVTSARLV
jgi:hypothetical protein